MHSTRAASISAVASISLAVVTALTLTACGGGSGSSSSGGGGGSVQTAPPTSGGAAPPTSSGLVDQPSVSDKVGVVATSTTIDANLSNPWGLAIFPGGPFWVADNNSNLSTLYSGTGEILTHVVTGSNDVGVAIPASAAGVPSNPTGLVFNGGGGFLIPTPAGQEPAMFMFDGEGGTIAAWAKDSGTTAVTMYDDGVANGANHAVYKGLALGTVNGATFLYATDLHNNKVDVFDTTFNKPAAMQGKFIDPAIPAGFVPFGIASLGGQAYVSYAMQDAAKHDETTGAGLGYVDVFDFKGNLVSQFASGGALNAPWGMALAPAGFGSIEGDLLIGNFGDGKINVFAPSATGLATPVGPLTVANGGTVSIPGLWSLVFGNGDADKPVTTLFYTAGFADQTDGVFGRISPSTSAAPPNPY